MFRLTIYHLRQNLDLQGKSESMFVQVVIKVAIEIANQTVHRLRRFQEIVLLELNDFFE